MARVDGNEKIKYITTICSKPSTACIVIRVRRLQLPKLAIPQLSNYHEKYRQNFGRAPL